MFKDKIYVYAVKISEQGELSMRRPEATKLMLPHYLNHVLFDSQFSKQDTISTQLNMVHNVSFL